MDAYLNHTDKELISLLLESDELAFETIYRRYAAELNRFACGKCGDRYQGEEIVQEIFVWLWTSRQNLERIDNLRTYLFTAAKNRILTHYRASKVREQYAESFSKFRATSQSSSEEQLEAAELEETILKNLSELPPKCQTAFRLSRIEHLSIPAVAEEMSISRRTVENYLTTALKHLRKTLANHH